MALISRGTKATAGGGTAFVTGTTASATEVNTDFDTIYNDYNGNVTDANIVSTGLTNTAISSSAGIAETKIDDISATDADHDDTTTPGDSSSHTKPTTLSGELQQLRYVAERLALGIAPDRVGAAGTGAAGWYDLPARGPNLVINPTLARATSASGAPRSWTSLGTGTPTFSYVALSGATLTEGPAAGKEHRIQAGSAATAGITQTIGGLKASTRYLVVARARSTTGAVHLKTVGADATSEFRNIDDSSSSTSYVTLKGVIQTDSTPTALEIQLTTNGGNGDDVKFAFCGVYECDADFVTEHGTSTPWVNDESTSNVSVDAATIALGPTLTLVAPNFGGSWQAEVHANIPIVRDSANGTTQIRLMTTVGGGGSTAVRVAEVTWSAANQAQNVSFMYTTSVAPGTILTYALEGESDAANVSTVPGDCIIGAPLTLKTVYLSGRFVSI